MPKINLPPSEMRRRRLVGKIKEAQEIQDISKQELADKLNVHINTMKSRIRNPDSFRLVELVRLCQVLEIPLDVVAECYGRDV